jgi:hypothetical protein
VREVPQGMQRYESLQIQLRRNFTGYYGKEGRQMMPKFTMTKVISLVSIIVVGVGSAIGQWATMKEWKEETDEKSKKED